MATRARCRPLPARGGPRAGQRRAGALGQGVLTPRDRDPAGRPRQARPRDALGRPLPYGAAGVEPVGEEALPPEDTVRVARELAAGGRAFAAHEVLEARWKAGPPAENDLWQGLAQICVGLTHRARGNASGAQRLTHRGAERLAAYQKSGGPTYDVDLPTLLRSLADGHVQGFVGG